MAAARSRRQTALKNFVNINKNNYQYNRIDDVELSIPVARRPFVTAALSNEPPMLACSPAMEIPAAGAPRTHLDPERESRRRTIALTWISYASYYFTRQHYFVAKKSIERETGIDAHG
ncbi:MAG TPA: hypothetical protein VK459_00205, partial [Polyangiaceae bacterium]|nr:hypothetical protein [Polyangiaceae bacterium]